MDTSVSSFLKAVELGELAQSENLTVVPLFHSQNIEPDYITLKDGLDSELLEVEELEEGASVNDIILNNHSKQYALLFEGEEFLGAMQNRILNITVLATPKSRQKLPVSCVEQGRWHHEHNERDKRRFKVADRVHYARGRAKENAAVTMNMASNRVVRGNQSGVWHDIEDRMERMKVSSATSASEDLYVSRQDKVDRFVKSLTPVSKQVGSVFLVDGRVSGLEIFSSEKTHRAMFSRLVVSHAMDALDRAVGDIPHKHTTPPSPNTEQLSQVTQSFIDGVSQSWVREFDGVGVGQNLRFKDDQLTGSALVHEDRILHLCAFATE